ncbi:MAG: DUF4245 domain-containing protein [Propioniciclava sp.]|uniref:DUF4245 domain-containing protein n=1 Tax=Propioniciclava sp. TaxID=2038686 RepID=UPI0039E265F3
MAAPRRNATVVQMIVAMLVIFIPAILITRLFTIDPEPPVNPIDWRPVAQAAADEASFAVVAPENLPESWVVTRARWIPAGQRGIGGDPVPADTWQFGVLTAERSYLGLDQRGPATPVFVDDVTRRGKVDGSSQAGGRTWERYVSEDGRTHSLVTTSDDTVTIVSGDLPYEALEAFASTLAPVS